MKISIEKLSPSEIEIRGEIPAQDFNSFLEKAIFSLGKNIEVEGFRKGKAPKEIIEKKVGREKILEEAANIALQEVYPKIALENNFQPIGTPELEILKLAEGNPFEFKIKTNILPELKLPDYKEILSQMKKKEVFLTAEEIERVRMEKERMEREKLRQEMLEKISEKSEGEIPVILIEEEKKRLLEETKRQIPFILQISFEDYLKKIGKNEKDLLDSFSKEAQKRVKNFLVLREIGKKENVFVSEEEIEKEIKKILENSKPENTLDLEKLREYTKNVIYNEKIFQKLESFLS